MYQNALGIDLGRDFFSFSVFHHGRVIGTGDKGRKNVKPSNLWQHKCSRKKNTFPSSVIA
jgi:hypothetical protein